MLAIAKKAMAEMKNATMLGLSCQNFILRDDYFGSLQQTNYKVLILHRLLKQSIKLTTRFIHIVGETRAVCETSTWRLS